MCIVIYFVCVVYVCVHVWLCSCTYEYIYVHVDYMETGFFTESIACQLGCTTLPVSLPYPVSSLSTGVLGIHCMAHFFYTSARDQTQALVLTQGLHFTN